MRGRIRRKRWIALVMAVLIGVTSFSETALAAFGSQADEAAGRETLKNLQDEQSVGALEAMNLLKQLGLIDEKGRPVTADIVMDQKSYTLEEMKAYMESQGERLDTTKKLTVDGTTFTIGDLQTMLQIEEELQVFQETYFPEDGTTDYTPEIEASLSSLFMQLNEGKLSIRQQDDGEAIAIDRNLQVHVSGSSVARGTKASVKISIDKPVTYPVYVEYCTLSGTAMKDVDYVEKSGTIKIEAGQTSGEAWIETKDSVKENDIDTWWNGDRKFYVELRNLRGAHFSGNKTLEYVPMGVQGNLGSLNYTVSHNQVGYQEPTGGSHGSYYSYSIDVSKELLAVSQAIDLKMHSFWSGGSNGYEAGFGTVNGDSINVTSSGYVFSPDYTISGDNLWNAFCNDYSQISNAGLKISENPDGIYAVTVEPSSYESSWYASMKPVYDNFETCYKDTKIPYIVKFNEYDSPAMVKTSGSGLDIGMFYGNDGERYGDTFSFLLSREDVKALEGEYDRGERLPVTGNTETIGGTPAGDLNIQVQNLDLLEFCGYEMSDENPWTEKDAITGITVDKPSESAYDPSKGELSVKVTVNYDRSNHHDDWIWDDYNNDFNKDGKASIDRLKVSLDGGKTIYSLQPPMDEKGDPIVNGMLTADVPLPYNASGEIKEYQAELFFMPKSQVTGVKSDYSCLLEDKHHTKFQVAPVTLVTQEDMTIAGIPEAGKIYMVKEDADVLSCVLNPDKTYTFPQIEWFSSNENVAKIDRMTGVIQPVSEGTVRFTATAYNRKLTQPVSVSTEELEVLNEGPPAITIPKGMNRVSVSRNNGVKLRWLTNMNVVIEEGQTPEKELQKYAVDIYEGDYTDKEKKLPEKGEGVPVKSYEIENGNEVMVEENVLSLVSENEIPAYTFVVTAKNPDKEEMLEARGGIIVLPKPASVRLLEPNRQYVTDATKSFQTEWVMADTREGYQFEFSVKKNGELIENVGLEGNSAVFPLDKVAEADLKDVYTVTAKVRNTENDVWSADSYLVQVYREGAFGFDVDDEKIADGGKVTLDNSQSIEALKNYNGSWTEKDSEKIVEMKRKLPLSKRVNISADEPWNMAADRFKWNSSDEGVIGVYRIDADGYSNISQLGTSYHAPDSQFLMSGRTEGISKISAVHSRTGKEISLTADVKTLKDKLYLFQFTPYVKTTVTYTAKDGSEVTIDSNDEGTLAIYDPDGIQSDLQLRSGEGKDLCLGTIYKESLISSEGDQGKNELYPVNYFTLREVARIKLYIKNRNGNPYLGNGTYTGGLYKNGVYCPDTQKGMSGERISFKTGKDGLLEMEFDPTRFYSEGEDPGTLLKPEDNLQFIFDIRTNEDTYYPTLVTVNGNTSKEASAKFGDGVVNQRVNVSGRKKPYIASQMVDYKLGSDRMIDVTDKKDNIGCSDQFPEIELISDIVCWGMEGNQVYKSELRDRNLKKASAQSYQFIQYPFTDLAISRNYTVINEAEGISKGKSRKYEAALYQGQTLVNTIDIPFAVANMIGVPNIQDQQNFKPITIDMELNQGVVDESVSAKGDIMEKGLDKFETGLKTPFFRLTITPTSDPTIFRAFAAYDIDFLNMDSNVVMNPDIESSLGANPSAFIAAVTGKGNSMSEKFDNKINSVMNKPGDTDYGARAAGYMAGNIVFNWENLQDPSKGVWDFVITDSGLTLGGKLGYHWTFNAYGFTTEFALGAAAEVDLKAIASYAEDVDAYGSDLLTTLRASGYIRAFAGFGFDVAIVALKVGLFGQVNLDHYTQFLNREYRGAGNDDKLIRHATKLTGTAGVEFIFKLFFISYRKVLASVSGEVTSRLGDTDKIGEWLESTYLPDWGGNPDPFSLSAQSLSTNLQEVYSESGLESRSYLNERSMLSGRNSTADGNEVLMENTYPYRYPEITRDGQLLVSLSDQGSEEVNDTKVTWSSVQDAVNGGTVMPEPSGWEEAQNGAEANVSLDGTSSFAVAAWEKVNDTVSQQDGADENTMMQRMMQGSEVIAGIYNGKEWKTTRLTDNLSADLAPSAASDGTGKGVVVWRNVAGSDPEEPLNFDVADELWYSSYQGGEEDAWRSPKLIHRETNGNITSLETAMDSEGNTGIVYSVSRKDSNNSVYDQCNDVFFQFVNKDGEASDPVRLTIGEGTNENAKITVVNYNGQERFITAWYQNRYDEELGSTLGDVCFRLLDTEGVQDQNFPDSLGEMNQTVKVAIGNKFEFVESLDRDLSDLAVAWSTTSMAEEGNEQSQRDLLYVSKFLTKDAAVSMTPGACVADSGENCKIDDFAVWSQGNEMNSIYLGSYYSPDTAQIETIYEGQYIYTVPNQAFLGQSGKKLENQIEVTQVSYDTAALKFGARLPVDFYLLNQGIEDISSVKVISQDGIVLAEEDTVIPPGASYVIHGEYQLPEKDSSGIDSLPDIEYKLQSFYGKQEISYEGKLILSTPDAGLSDDDVKLLKEEQKNRVFRLKCYNTSPNSLLDQNYKVSVEFTKEGGVPADVKLIDAEAAREPLGTGVYYLTEDQIGLLDENALAMDFSYQLEENDVLPMNLYARICVRDPKTGGLVVDFDVLNDSKLITFQDPVARNNGEPILATAQMEVQDKKSTAIVNVKNLSCDLIGNINVKANLYNEKGKLLESHYLAVSQEELIQLEAEMEVQKKIEFSQAGTNLKVTAFTQEFNEASTRLTGLEIDQVTLEQVFSGEVQEYQATSKNLQKTTVSASPESMTAQVLINGQAAEGGTMDIDLQPGQNIIEIEVIPAQEGMESGTYRVVLDNKMTVVQGLTLNEKNLADKDSWKNKNLIYQLSLSEGVDESQFVAFDYSVDSGINWSGRQDWIQSEDNTFTIVKDGIYENGIIARAYKQDGSYLESGMMSAKLDSSLPVISDVTYEKLDEELMIFDDSIREGNWNGQLRVKINAEDNLSGLGDLKAVQENGDQKAYEVTKEEDGCYSFVISEVYRGNIQLTLEDQAGNETSQSIRVNVDNKVPVGKLFETSLSKTGFTAEPVEVMIQVIHQDMDKDTLEYAVGEEKVWKKYEDPIKVDENTIIYYRAKDTSGNMSEIQSVQVANIDKEKPSVKLETEQSLKEWNAGDVMVTLVNDSKTLGSTQFYYRESGKNTKKWERVQDGVITFTKEGEHEIEVYAVTEAGIKSETVAFTVRIDKSSPEGSLKVGRWDRWEKLTKKSEKNLEFYNQPEIEIKTEDKLSGIREISYAVSTVRFSQEEDIAEGPDLRWKVYSKGTKLKLPEKKTVVVYAKLIDRAGNITYISTDDILYKTPEKLTEIIKGAATGDYAPVICMLLLLVLSGVVSTVLYYKKRKSNKTR